MIGKRAVRAGLNRGMFGGAGRTISNAVSGIGRTTGPRLTAAQRRAAFYSNPRPSNLRPDSRARAARRGIFMDNKGLAATSNAARAMLGGPVSPAKEAVKGRNVSRMVAGGVVGAAAVGAFSNRSGRAADRPVGRPTGVYGF